MIKDKEEGKKYPIIKTIDNIKPHLECICDLFSPRSSFIINEPPLWFETSESVHQFRNSNNLASNPWVWSHCKKKRFDDSHCFA